MHCRWGWLATWAGQLIPPGCLAGLLGWLIELAGWATGWLAGWLLALATARLVQKMPEVQLKRTLVNALTATPFWTPVIFSLPTGRSIASTL